MVVINIYAYLANQNLTRLRLFYRKYEKLGFA